MNAAPEPFMLKFAPSIFGEGYYPCDYSPELFRSSPVKITKVNFCTDLDIFPPGIFDVVMHNHVLEHVPCDVSRVLKGLTRLLSPGGYHLFSVPVLPNRSTTEDLSDTLTPEDRKRLFHQEDHMRIFGALDFSDLLDAAEISNNLIDLTSLVSAIDLLRYAIPPEVLDRWSPHRVLIYRRPF